jgi:hypothetical protein
MRLSPLIAASLLTGAHLTGCGSGTSAGPGETRQALAQSVRTASTLAPERSMHRLPADRSAYPIPDPPPRPASEGISHELGEREETEPVTQTPSSPSLGSENGPESSN